MQITVPVAVSGTLASLARNLGKQTNQGIELEAVARPIDNLTVSGFVSHLSAESDVTISGAPAVNGRQVAYQPRWKYNVTVRYDVPLEDGGDIGLQADYSYQGRTLSPDLTAPPPANDFNSFGVANARVEWNRVGGRNINVAVFVKNAFDKDYVIGGYPILAGLGFESVIYGEPRTFGGSIRIYWGK